MESSPTALLASPLSLVGEVAARLAGTDDIVRKTSDVLERVVSSLGASECSLWLSTPAGLVCAVRRGLTEATQQDVHAQLERESASGELHARRMSAVGRRLGALAMRLEGAAPDALIAFEAVADMLASELVRADQARQSAVAGAAGGAGGAGGGNDERRFFEQVIDSLPLGLYVIDREYRISLWNRKRESGSQGVQREQALGRTIFEILHRAPAEKLKREFDEVFQSGRLQQFHMETRGSGDRRTFRISKVPVRAQDGGDVTHLITVGEDVTHWTAARDRIAQSEKLAAIGRLAAGVLKEIDAPLGAIAGSARRLAAAFQNGSNPDPSEAEAIEGQLDRCRSIVEGLRQLSRSSGGLGVSRRATSVNTLVDQTLALLRHHERFRQLNITTSLSPNLPAVQADPEQLIQVLVALVTNAAESMAQAAGGENGRITIHTLAGDGAEDAVIAEVIDEGHGISPEILPRIFDPFFTTRGRAGATGLGLSICHSIVSEHGGHMAVDSAVGVGSTFRIFLPGAEAL
ncbi:MAG: two-component system sensor histidine kinase NtrB [Gemmatimonadota bacterium]